jgi:Flp pilus assembly protein TadD
MGRGTTRRILAIFAAILLLTACNRPAPPTPSADAQKHFQDGRAALDAKDYPRAVTELEQAIQLDPNLGEAHFRLGNAYLQLKDYGKAETAFRSALKIDPDDANAHANLGVTLYAQDRLPEAEAEFRAGLKATPDDAELHYLLGATLLQQNRLDAARAELEKAVALKPDLPEAWYGLGVYHKLAGDKAEAIKAFERFLQLPPAQDPQARTEAEKELQELKAAP